MKYSSNSHSNSYSNDYNNSTNNYNNYKNNNTTGNRNQGTTSNSNRSNNIDTLLIAKNKEIELLKGKAKLNQSLTKEEVTKIKAVTLITGNEIASFSDFYPKISKLKLIENQYKFNKKMSEITSKFGKMKPLKIGF